MKKFLAVLLSAVLCATVAYSACAEESVPEETATPETTQTEIKDVVDALKNDEQAQELANKIVDAIKTGAAKKDVADLLANLSDYVGNADLKIEDLKDAGAVRDVLDMFLADAGVDSEELNDAISESTIANKILDIYYSAPVEKPEEETPVEEEETIIPDTGFIG